MLRRLTDLLKQLRSPPKPVPAGVPATHVAAVLAREPVAGWGDTHKRRVIVHYHFFKNAGTSLDETLREYFGERWVSVEGQNSLSPADLAKLIADQPERAVFSSHTASFPVPDLEGVAIFPVVFVRHPIDRIRSVYEFERRQQPAVTRGAIVAKKRPFKGYVRWRLAADNQIRNFHVTRFSRGEKGPPSLPSAIKYVDRLPFVGVVERFSDSLSLLQRHLNLAFPDIRLTEKHANVTRNRNGGIEQRLAAVRADLGPRLYDAVVEQNRDDLLLYEHVVERLAREIGREAA